MKTVLEVFLIAIVALAFMATIALSSNSASTSLAGTSTLDSYNPTPDFLFGNGNGTARAIFTGETFTITANSWQVTSAQFLMNKTNTWTGGIVAQVWNIQGTPGTNGLPLGTSSSGAFPQGSLATSNALTNSALLPTNTTAVPVTFTFPSSPVLNPGSYVVTLTENSTQASGASPLIGNGFVAAPNVIVQIGMRTGGLAGHNAFRDTGIILNNGRNFWFIVTGANTVFVPAQGLVILIPAIFAAIVIFALYRHGIAEVAR